MPLLPRSRGGTGLLAATVWLAACRNERGSVIYCSTRSREP